MGSDFDSFDQSALGVFIQSPLGARGLSFSPTYVAGGTFTNRVNHFLSSEWVPIDNTGANAEVQSVEKIGSDLYIGGNFTTVDGISAVKVAKFSGTGWSAVGTLPSSIGSSAKVINFNGTPVAFGGSTTNGVGDPDGSIFEWTGSTWDAIGAADLHLIHGAIVFNDDLS